MPLFGSRDEAKELVKKAERLYNPSKKEFDLNQAIGNLRQAIDLKPDKAEYRGKLVWAYLIVPQLAVTHGAKIGFSLERSAELALREYEKAYSVPALLTKGAYEER